MVKRLVAAAAGALVALALAAPAGAQQYPPAQNSLTISDPTPTPGQSVDITAQTYTGSVTITMNSEPVVLGSATADSSGVARLTATIPANATLGTHTLVATGTGADGAPLTVTLSFTVVAADGSGSGAAGGLPRTGDDSSLPLARVGLGLAAAGGVITAVAAKRRKVTAAV